MPLTITHGTAADGSFSAAGATAWNENHTLAGSVALDEITAATGAVTIASGNNTGIVWNWANTTNTTVAFTFGETTAATNGTSTSGVPNQVLLKLTTLASSTQSPLSVFSRSAHVFSVSPSAAQILATAGNKTNPAYSFTASTNTGIFQASSQFGIAVGGVNLALWGSGPGQLALMTGNTSLETVSNVGGLNIFCDNNFATSLAYIKSSNDANGVVYALRKSRGTISAPTVITTGDDLHVIGAYGYLGATNTYQEACRITFDSTGTISDATNGIGGILRFLTRKQGVDTAVVERFRVDDAGHLVSIAGTANTPTITAGGGTNPTIAGTDSAFTVTIGTGGTATSVEVTFATAYANAPIAVAQSDTDILALKSTPTTTKVTITAATPFTAGSNIDVVCIGRA